jgi:type IV pilus assembly protein PilM
MQRSSHAPRQPMQVAEGIDVASASRNMKTITLRKPKDRAKHKGVVGLDIESSSIAATELRINGSVQVSGFGVAALGAGIVRDGEVREPEELGDAIKELFSDRKLPRDVRLGIANQQVAVRTLQLPMIDNDNELDAAVRFAAQDHIPMPLDRAVLDWQRIPSPPVQEGVAPTIEVVAVAARREMLEPAVEAIRRSGLRLVGIDHSAFALIRALSRGNSVGVNGSPIGAGAEAGDGTLVDPALKPAPAYAADQEGRLFCNLGDITNLAFARGSSCLFSRVLNFGTEGIAQSLSEKSSLTLEHARQWLIHVGLEAPLDGIEGDPEIVASARESLSLGAGRLVDELRRSLEYYATLEGATQITSVVVAGSGVAIPGLVDHLRTELPLPLEAAIPGPLAAAAGSAAGRLTLSYGLGLED